MAATHAVSAQDVTRRLADSIGADPIVRAIHLHVGDRIGVWIVTLPVSIEEMRRLYAPVAELYRDFPGIEIDYHVLNPRNFEDDVNLIDEVVPRSALPLPLPQAR